MCDQLISRQKPVHGQTTASTGQAFWEGAMDLASPLNIEFEELGCWEAKEISHFWPNNDPKMAPLIRWVGDIPNLFGLKGLGDILGTKRYLKMRFLPATGYFWWGSSWISNFIQILTYILRPDLLPSDKSWFEIGISRGIYQNTGHDAEKKLRMSPWFSVNFSKFLLPPKTFMSLL